MKEESANSERDGDFYIRRRQLMLDDAIDFRQLKQNLLRPELDAIESKLAKLESSQERYRNLLHDLPLVLDTEFKYDGERENRLLRDSFRGAVEKSLSLSVEKDQAVMRNAIYPVMGSSMMRFFTKSIANVQDAVNVRIAALSNFKVARWWLDARKNNISFSDYFEMMTNVCIIERVYVFDRGELEFLRAYERCERNEEDHGDDEDSGGFELMEVQSMNEDEVMWAQSILAKHKSEEIYWTDTVKSPFSDKVKMIAYFSGSYAVASFYKGMPQANFFNSIQDICRNTEQNNSLETKESKVDFMGSALREYVNDNHVNKEENLRVNNNAFKNLLKVLLILGVLFSSYMAIREYNWQKLIRKLNDTPGIIISAHSPSYHIKRWIRGWQDPYAKSPTEIAKQSGYSPTTLELSFANFKSYDLEFKQMHNVEWQRWVKNWHEKNLPKTTKQISSENLAKREELQKYTAMAEAKLQSLEVKIARLEEKIASKVAKEQPDNSKVLVQMLDKLNSLSVTFPNAKYVWSTEQEKAAAQISQLAKVTNAIAEREGFELHVSPRSSIVTTSDKAKSEEIMRKREEKIIAILRETGARISKSMGEIPRHKSSKAEVKIHADYVPLN